MKKVFELIFLLFVFFIIITYRQQITSFITDNFIHKKDVFTSSPNNYSLNYDYKYINKTNDFFAKDKQQVLDIFYTYLNNGEDEFYFFCEYEDCQKDINTLTNENMFVNINNFIHPFNTYNRLYITSNSWGKIEIKVDKTYSENDINEVNKKIYQVIDEIITDNMTDKQKIKAFHDYVIKNTKYDNEYVEDGITDMNSASHKANGPLIHSKALCGGYTHAMSVFLNILKIPNYRISSDTHIWNLVYLDNNWYHLDLTWDDPSNYDTLLDNFFMISTKKLESLNTGYHVYDKNIYQETN